MFHDDNYKQKEDDGDEYQSQFVEALALLFFSLPVLAMRY